MEKKKIYVFFTYQIIKIGGTQLYTAGKANYLKKLGWQVHVFFCGSNKEKSDILFLDEYVKNGGGCNFLNEPPYRLTVEEQKRCLDFMLSRLNLSDFQKHEIIIESHYDTVALWAELLAEKIEARHFFFCCNEIYRPIPTLMSKYYEDNLDFFYFKWRRNELIGRQDSGAWKKLFNGYKNVTEPLTNMPLTVMEMNPIQDVDFPEFEKIQKLDWNICHIGRAEKNYVPHVIKGVGELAQKYPEKKINFILVGNALSRMELLNEIFKNLSNVKLTLLGDLMPIPKILFSKTDVVCAIAQAATFTADAGAFTIVGSRENPEKNRGLLGYDTMERTFGKGIFSYVETLENVLVKRLYDNKKYLLPKLKPADEYYENFWTIVNNAAQDKEYYTERLSQDRIRVWFAPFPFSSISRGSKIILAGATEIATDYIKQVQCQQTCKSEISSDGVKKLDGKPYCTILTTVDEHPENFDDSVVGFERLKQIDYDAIVLTAYSWEVEKIREKILKIVPQMSDRIIENLQFINIYRMYHKEIKLFED